MSVARRSAKVGSARWTSSATPQGLGAHVQFQNAGHHDHGLRTVPILEHRKLQGFSAVDKEATMKPALILHDPIAVAILANQEERRFRSAQRGRLAFVHGTCPLLVITEALLPALS
jgi:hypothetical protein